MHELLDDELWPGGASELEVRGRAELEFELCQREGRPAVLACIEVEGLDRIAREPAKKREVLRAITAILRGYPRSGSLYAHRAGNRIHAFLPLSTVEAAELALRLLIEASRKLAVPGSAAPVRASLSIGLAAIQPELDLWYETLVQVALEGIDVASSNGSECFVHTQLYGLYQRKLERERPRPPRAAPGAGARDDAAAGAHSATRSGAHAVVAPSGTHGSPEAGATLTPTAGVAESSDPLPVVARPEHDPEFTAEVRAEIARVAGRAPGIADLEPHLVALAHGFARTAIERVLLEERALHARELDKLERRLAKLAQSLEQTEEELRRVQNEKSVDRGISSAYRYVQGLALDEQSYERKLGLLQAIVEQNLELQKELLSQRSA